MQGTTESCALPDADDFTLDTREIAIACRQERERLRRDYAWEFRRPCDAGEVAAICDADKASLWETWKDVICNSGMYVACKNGGANLVPGATVLAPSDLKKSMDNGGLRMMVVRLRKKSEIRKKRNERSQGGNRSQGPLPLRQSPATRQCTHSWMVRSVWAVVMYIVLRHLPTMGVVIAAFML